MTLYTCNTHTHTHTHTHQARCVCSKLVQRLFRLNIPRYFRHHLQCHPLRGRVGWSTQTNWHCEDKHPICHSDHEPARSQIHQKDTHVMSKETVCIVKGINVLYLCLYLFLFKTLVTFFCITVYSSHYALVSGTSPTWRHAYPFIRYEKLKLETRSRPLSLVYRERRGPREAMKLSRDEWTAKEPTVFLRTAGAQGRDWWGGGGVLMRQESTSWGRGKGSCLY